MPEGILRMHDDVMIFKEFPILWFGDRNQYYQSKIKIITVGLNPSDLEVRADRTQESDLKFRFPEFDGTQEGHIRALNNYFRVRPYKSWFQRAFQDLLYSFDSSFYDNTPNRALHTDFCSPYATSPTWSRLPKYLKEQLFKEGIKLWHNLVHELRPDYILMSIKKVYKNEINLKPIDDWHILSNIKSNKPVELRRFDVDGKMCTVVFQPQGRWPFMHLSKDIKKNFYEQYLK